MSDSCEDRGGREALRYGFITYVSRSGSTLLSRLLNQHPEICVCTEAHLPKELFRIGPYGGLSFPTAESLADYLRRIGTYSKLESWELDLDQLVASAAEQGWPLSGDELLRLLLRVYKEKHAPGADIVLYKGPPAMPWDMPSVVRAFSNFACIHLIRDPRAVHASQRKAINPYSGRPFVSDSFETARQWRSAMLASSRVPAQRFREIRYEDLVANPDATLEELCRYLDVAFEARFFRDASKDFSSRLPKAEGMLHSRIDAPPDRSRIEAWRANLDSRDICRLEAILRAEMIDKGYASQLPQRRLARWAGLFRIRMRLVGRWFARVSGLISGLVRGDRRYLDKIRGLGRARHGG